MQTKVLKEMHKLSHDNEQRYQLLMRYLRLREKEKKQRGLLSRLKKQWNAHNKNITAETWNKHSS
ncbi:hypothetical protein [Cohnella abietis]|nr:hypothetical protein [Cohnella abietis]